MCSSKLQGEVTLLMRQINIDNLMGSKNPLIVNFLKQKEVGEYVNEYRKKPSKYLSDQILSSLEDYFNYVMMLNSLKRNIHFKNQPFFSRNKDKSHIVYVPNEILDTNKTKELFTSKRNWEDVIEDDIILNAIMRLDKKSQRILWMIIVEQSTQKEISDSLNLSQQAISKEKKSIMNKLKRVLI